MSVGRFFSRGGNIGFLQGVTKRFYPRKLTVVKFHFNNAKLREKQLSTKKLIGK